MANQLPLSGLRVVELGNGITAAFCTRMLAGLGAEVWKIEAPGSGDRARHTPDLDGSDCDAEINPLFLYLNTGKKSITLSLEHSVGCQVLARLVNAASCLVENLAPGELARLGLAPESLWKTKPALVVTSISPFGQTGPYRDFQVTNLIEFAMGGQMALTGEPDREPLINGGSQAEYQAGLNALCGTLAVLARAMATGQGEHLDISVMECQAAALEAATPATAAGPPSPLADAYCRRRGNVISAIWGLYPVKDGHAGPYYARHQYPKFPALIEWPQMLEDERFKDISAMLANNDALVAIVGAYFAEHTRRELFDRAPKYQGCVGFVADLKDALDSPQERVRRFFARLEHPKTGAYQVSGAPWIINDGDQDLQFQISPAPMLGQHTDEVLRDVLGLASTRIAELRTSGVI